MDMASSLIITQIPYYVVLFFCIREIRKLRSSDKLKIIID